MLGIVAELGDVRVGACGAVGPVLGGVEWGYEERRVYEEKIKQSARCLLIE